MLGLDLLVELLEAFELRREAAFGGGVDDQDDFVFEAREGIGLAFFWEGRDVSRVGRGCSVMWGGRDVWGPWRGRKRLRTYVTYYQEA